MGLRFRKSINIGGFRINCSKSGIGYSYGFKGARVTRTSRGTTRTTLSIPGTGVSWVSETKRRKSSNRSVPKASTQKTINNDDQVLLQSIESGEIEQLASTQEADFIHAIEKYLTVNMVLTSLTIIAFLIPIIILKKTPYFVCSMIPSIVLLGGMLFYRFCKKVNVQYDFDDVGQKKAEAVKEIARKLMDMDTIWQVNTVLQNNNTKAHAGASKSLGTTRVFMGINNPAFLKTNVTVYGIKLDIGKVYVFPDKLLIVNGTRISAIHFDDIEIYIANRNFIVDTAPGDARIAGYTWQYVNKNGGPDKRYKNNKKLAVCDVGLLQFTTPAGLNVMLYLSNVYGLVDISNIMKQANSMT
ncbi:MAG: DUF4236 domain-containing protein [Lachnospiraceae bacterium]|nr:DUF4236 domain-containing protein [Lachnospiraceae bacterium]